MQGLLAAKRRLWHGVRSDCSLRTASISLPLLLPLQALSQGELTAALYNIACCRARLGDIENGLVAIAGAVEQGERVLGVREWGCSRVVGDGRHPAVRSVGKALGS